MAATAFCGIFGHNYSLPHGLDYCHNTSLNCWSVYRLQSAPGLIPKPCGLPFALALSTVT